MGFESLFSVIDDPLFVLKSAKMHKQNGGVQGFFPLKNIKIIFLPKSPLNLQTYGCEKRESV